MLMRKFELRKPRAASVFVSIAFMTCMSFLSDHQLVEKLQGYQKTFFSGYRGNTAARQLSISLGNGNCRWRPPEYDIPTDIDFYKTVIAGYPSGDKRLTFIQLEGEAL